MIKKVLIFSLLLGLSSATAFAGRYISDAKLWKHVVTVDRLAWEEREGIKKVNKVVSDQDFARRIYIDITGKIPTYDQLLSFLKDKNINKREKLIEKLLASPGYVSNFSNFWLDLLRGPLVGSLDEHFHREFTRHIERFLHENQPYDKIVKNLIMAEGEVQENPAIGFYYRDKGTNSMDTFNATTRAFLGTRLGCAQCHNHRFDKWTQKEFYESAAHFWGIDAYRTFYRPEEHVWQNHQKEMMKDKRFKGLKFSAYSDVLFKPSRARVTYDDSENLTYPETYRYDNAKPNSAVQHRIVFGYGDSKVEGKDRREEFANWLASKNNPMFSRIMPNRLWKRIMGVTMLEPLDDWKDDTEIRNPKLFKALDDIFIDVNFDFKALLSIIFNSEAYQLSIDLKNEFLEEDYKMQGSLLKRMSAAQLKDSLLTLQYGPLDRHARIEDAYFEFEEKLQEITFEYKQKIVPMTKALIKSDDPKNRRYCNLVSDEMLDVMFTYLEKLNELEEYYNIGEDGFVKDGKERVALKAVEEEMEAQGEMMMMRERSSRTSDPKSGMIMRANYHSSELMQVFGNSEYTSPDTVVNTKATMKQLLKMINGKEVHAVTQEDSFLMRRIKNMESLGEKISFLYYSVYGRAPSKKDLSIANQFLKESAGDWSSYTLALLNSPEFYFVK